MIPIFVNAYAECPIMKFHYRNSSNKYHFIYSVLVEFWYDVFKKLVAEIITKTISPALGIDGAVSFSRKLENSGLIHTITNLLYNLVSTNIP